METVTFPSFHLQLHIQKIAIQLGNLKINWYAILIVLAFIIGMFLCKKDEGRYQIKWETIMELLLWTIPIAMIGARFYYVAFHLDYYLANPAKIIRIQDGGLAIYGGILGGIGTIAIYCKIKKIDMLDV